MAKIQERVIEAVGIHSAEFEDNEYFKKLDQDYQKFKESGCIQENKYIVSPLDTIGRKLYEESSTYKKYLSTQNKKLF